MLLLSIVVEDLVLSSLYLFFSVYPQLFSSNCKKAENNDCWRYNPQYFDLAVIEIKRAYDKRYFKNVFNLPTLDVHIDIPVATRHNNSQRIAFTIKHVLNVSENKTIHDCSHQEKDWKKVIVQACNSSKAEDPYSFVGCSNGK